MPLKIYLLIFLNENIVVGTHLKNHINKTVLEKPIEGQVKAQFSSGLMS